MRILALLATLATLATARAQFPTAEHLLYIRIETEPTAATLYTVSTKEGGEPALIGRTPLVIPVELNWDRAYMRKKWELLRATSRAGIATNTYDPADKTHTITLTFALAKEGHETRIIQQTAAVLQFDTTALNWDHAIKALPERRTLSYTLVPLTTNEAALASANATATAKLAPPTVIVARGAATDASKLGYALVESATPAEVFVNGMTAGTTPLRVMLPEGTHTIGTTLKNGKPAPAQTISIESGKTIPVTLDTGK